MLSDRGPPAPLMQVKTVDFPLPGLPFGSPRAYVLPKWDQR